MSAIWGLSGSYFTVHARPSESPSIPVEELSEGLFVDGIGFDGSSIRGFQHIHESDMLLMPDPASVFIEDLTLTELRDLIVKYNEVLLAQVQTTAACNALHHVEARLSRWILQTRDRTETDSIPLTQEFLSEMLGVRRTSVSEVAQKLQTEGLIRYSRGVIEIVDRLALERRACECYAGILEKSLQIFPNIQT